ncbi:MAG: lytic transglycosylase domain-containing protein [Bdellovibrionales bacterium]
MSSQKTRAIVAAPSKEELLAAEKAARLDKAMGALCEKEAALYRLVFAAQGRGAWKAADELAKKITDQRLMGAVLADRFEKRGASGLELAAWLQAYATLPQADDFYAKAKKDGMTSLTRPQSTDAWSDEGEIDGAANFAPDLMVKNTAANSQTNSLARAIQRTLRKGDPWAARNLLLEAQNQKKLEGTFAHDAQAVIGAAFFRVGERDQAMALTGAAAGANQPLGLWIRGLIAWEKNDAPMARMMFSRLAEHPALNEGNRAAAHFWAYRAEKAQGSGTEARRHLEEAARVPRSFYGLLAGQLLGRSPVAILSKDEAPSVWDATARSILLKYQAGWRALALVQVGQLALAEGELRRLNPQNDPDKQQAMMALARYVPMPALALKLAHLSRENGFDLALYPLLPWQPKEGYQVDRALMFALARHESLFDPMAMSARGAQGLMQIMPATASVMADNEEDVRAIAHQDKLFDPAYNIELGQKYVQHLAAMPQIGNNLILLLAAYNGGPAKAINLASSRDGADPLLFLESMPVRETRNYVARVLPHYWAYRARLGKSLSSLKQMAEGRWPTTSLREETTLRVAEVVNAR